MSWILWLSGIFFLVLRRILLKKDFKFAWILHYALLILGIWALAHAPIPFFSAAWDTPGEIAANIFEFVVNWVIGLFGGSGGASYVAAVILVLMLVGTVIDLWDQKPNAVAKSTVYAAPALVLVTGGVVASTVGQAIAWVGYAAPNIVITLTS